MGRGEVPAVIVPNRAGHLLKLAAASSRSLLPAATTRQLATRHQIEPPVPHPYFAPSN